MDTFNAGNGTPSPLGAHRAAPAAAPGVTQTVAQTAAQTVTPTTATRPAAPPFAAEHEGSRLRCLRSLAALDTPPDPALDALVRAASDTLGCPIGLLSLVDADRQWFKARHGLDVDETPRAWAFCDHTIRHDEVFVVADAATDARFAANPLVTAAPHLRFYAGAPLTVRGHRLGTLCVADRVPRAPDAAALKALARLAQAAAALLERDLALREARLELVRQRDFVAASADFLWECDASLKLVWASPQAADHVLPAFAAAGQRLWDGPLLEADGEPATPTRSLHQLLAVGTPLVARRVALHGPAGHRPYAVSALPLHAADGTLLGWRGMGRSCAPEIDAVRGLRASDERLAAIAAHVPGMLFEIERPPQGPLRLPFASTGVARLFGMQPAALREDASALLARLTEPDRAALPRALLASARRATDMQLELCLDADTAAARWVELRASPYRHADGGTRWRGFAHDVTERRGVTAQLQEAQQRLRMAMRAARLGVIVFDIEGGAVLLDKQARIDHGLPADQDRLPLWWWYERIEQAQRTAVQRALRIAAQASTPQALAFAVRGLPHWIEIHVERFEDGGRLIGVCRETGEQRRAEAALREREQAAERRRRETEFVSRASHELRTPMNAILGFVQLLAADTATPLSAQHRAWVDHVRDAGEHLMELISDLLDLSQLESGDARGRHTLVPLDLVVRQCGEMMSALAARSDARIEYDTTAPRAALLGSPRALRQVLLNLIGNAVKFNRPGGRVLLRTAADAETLRLEVEDEGPGLPPQSVERLFRPFERLGAEAGPVEGSGLGLAIARAAAESMGGRLELARSDARGTCMRLVLPAAAELSTLPAELELAPPQPAPAAARRPDPPARRGAAERTEPFGWLAPDSDASAVLAEVWAAEDNDVNALLLEAVVAQRPAWALRRFSSAEALLSAAESPHLQAPRLLLLDLHLPKLDGAALLQLLRLRPGFAQAHAVLLSADSGADTQRHAQAVGFDECIGKPFAVAWLLALLDRLAGLPAPAGNAPGAS